MVNAIKQPRWGFWRYEEAYEFEVPAVTTGLIQRIVSFYFEVEAKAKARHLLQTIATKTGSGLHIGHSARQEGVICRDAQTKGTSNCTI